MRFLQNILFLPQYTSDSEKSMNYQQHLQYIHTNIKCLLIFHWHRLVIIEYVKDSHFRLESNKMFPIFTFWKTAFHFFFAVNVTDTHWSRMRSFTEPLMFSLCWDHVRFETQSWCDARFDALTSCAKLQVNTFSLKTESQGIDMFWSKLYPKKSCWIVLFEFVGV